MQDGSCGKGNTTIYHFRAEYSAGNAKTTAKQTAQDMIMDNLKRNQVKWKLY